MDATLATGYKYNLSGNDFRNAETIHRLTAPLSNADAWREIFSHLAKAGYRGPYLTAMRDEIWRGRLAAKDSP